MAFHKVKLLDHLYRVIKTWPFFYDGVTQLLSIGQWQRWQDRVFEDLEGKRILEIGVGPGHLFSRIAKKGYTVTGIELRKGIADEARRKIKKLGLDSDILFQSVYKLPFKDYTFDCVVMTFVTAEIVDLDKTIEEIKRILKTGGKTIIISGGIPQDNNIFARILFKTVQFQTTLRLERDTREYFIRHGFKVKREDFGPFNIINKIIAIKQ